MIQDNIRSYVDVMNGEELAKQLLAEVRRDVEIKVTDNDTQVKLEEIRKILEGLDSNLAKEINDLTQKVEQTANSTKRGPGSGGSTAAPTKLTNNVGTLNATLAKTNLRFSGLNRSMNNSISVLAKAMRTVSRGVGGFAGTVAAAAAASFRSGGGGGGSATVVPVGGSVNVPGDDGSGDPTKFGKNNLVLAGTNAAQNKAISSFENGLDTMGIEYKKTFAGIFRQGPEHVQDMRAFLYTTQGAGVAMTNLEKASIELNNAAAETGRTWGEVATLTRKEMYKGLTTEIVAGKVHTRNANDAMRLTKNSLRTANMIDASAENTAEIFSEWNRHLGMTNEQLAFVGREMEQIAKNSGVTGDDLLAATKAASVLVKEVRNFAGISQQAMAQIIQTQTSLQKFGAEDIGAKFNQAMSQGVRSLAQAEPVIASIIAEAAQKAGVSVTGSMLTGGAQQRKMLQAINETLKGRLASIGLGGVDPTQLLDKLEEMRDAGQDTGMLEQQIKNVTGMGAGELQNFAKANEEASMSFQKRMKGFEDRINNSTTSEGRALAQRQKDDFLSTDKRQQLSTFSDMLGKKGDINKAVEQFNQRMTREGRGDATLSGPDAARQLVQKGVSGIADRAKGAGVDLNAALKKRGMTREGLERGLLDPKSAKEFGAILQEVENEVLTQEKANQDPVMKANLALAKINEALTKAATKLYMAFASFELIMGIAIALMAAKVGMSLMTLSNLTGLAKVAGGAGRMLGIGTAATAATAAGTAATAGTVAGRATGAAAFRRGGTAAASRGGDAVAFRVGGTAASRAAAQAGGTAAQASGGLLANIGSKIGLKAFGGAGLKASVGSLGSALVSTTRGISFLASSLLGGFIGAMDAAANATTIFKKKQEDLTYTNIAAAKTAGFVTGMFDFITFGLFDHWIGPTGTMTVALAEFFDAFWPLAVAFDIAIKPLEAIWGLLKGIWFFAEEVFSGIWEGIKAIWEPINTMFNEINGLIGPAGKTIDVVKIISGSLGWLGKQVGVVFKFIGQTIGGAIGLVVSIFKVVGKILTSLILPAFEIFQEYLMGVWDVLSGIFTLDGDKIMRGLETVFDKVPDMMSEAIANAWIWVTDKLPEKLSQAWDWIKVNVPKYLEKAWSWLVTSGPKYLEKAWDWLKNNGPKILLGVLVAVLAGVALWFGGLPVLLAPLLYKGFVWIVNNLPGLLYRGFSWFVNDLPTLIKDAFMGVVDGIWSWIQGMIPGGKTVAGIAEGTSKTLDELKQGNVLGAAREAGTTVLNTGANLVNGLTSNALTRAVGLDFELFDIGSMGINNDGLAYLHKGEMVIPPEDAAQLKDKATSKAAFNGSGLFGGMAKGASSALGLGMFNKDQGKEAGSEGMASWIHAFTLPLLAPLEGLSNMFGFGGLDDVASSAGSWLDSAFGAEQTPVSDQPTADKSLTVEEYLQTISNNGLGTNKLLGDMMSTLNTGLFDSTNISDAVYESSLQSEKKFDNMFASSLQSEKQFDNMFASDEMLAPETTGPLIIEAQEVLIGEAGALDAGLFSNDQAAEALDVLNSEIIQQNNTEKTLWDKANDVISSVLNPGSGGEGVGGGIMDSLQRVWEDLSGRTERAASNPVDTGLFLASQAKETFDEAMKGGISGGPIGRLMDMFGFGNDSKPAAGAGSSLYYNKEAEYQQATTQTGASGGTTNNFVNQGRRVRGMPVKGGINTNMLSSSGDVEEYITTSRLLNESSSGNGGGMASAMLERIVDALEGGRIDEIIMLLTAIRDKTTDVMVNAGGGGASGAPSVENSGLRDGYNKAWINGDWTHLGDPSFSDNANILGTSR